MCVTYVRATLCTDRRTHSRDSMRKHARLAFSYPLSASCAVFFFLFKNNIVISLDATLRVQEVNLTMRVGKIRESNQRKIEYI